MNDERWQHLFREYSNSSFSDLLRRDSPHLFPSPAAARPPVEQPAAPEPVPHGTTVLALRYRDGLIMAGDRQATAGDQVASRRIEKIFKADDEDVGTGGPDLVRGIFPTVKTITRSGFGDVADDEVKRVCEAILADRARTENGG